MIRAVMFDLDGTLVHSAPGILASFRKTFEVEGVKAVETLDESVIGPPLMATLARLTGIADQARLDALAQTFKAMYDTEGVRLAEPYPGMLDVLKQIRAGGGQSFIVTNKRIGPAGLIAEHLGMLPYLGGVYALDSSVPPAPKKHVVLGSVLAEHGILPAQALMVGDSVEDAAAAAANSVRFAAATFGYGSPLQFTDVAPVVVLQRLADLPGALAGL